MKDIHNINAFVRYCEDLIEDAESEDNTDWVLHVIAADATKEELLADVQDTLGVYYKWLGFAQSGEAYYVCGIIYHAILIESEHYIKLGHQVLKTSIKKEVTTINKKLKDKYLNVL